MAMNIVAMVSYIYCGKSVFQALSPRGEVWVWGPGLGLDMPSRTFGGRHYQIPPFNNAVHCTDYLYVYDERHRHSPCVVECAGANFQRRAGHNHA